MSDIELLPCAHCGGPAVAVGQSYDAGENRGWRQWWWAHCLACFARSDRHDSREAAIAAWNRRASDPLVADAREAAERIVERSKIGKARPSIAELERLLQQEAPAPITINPDGSIGVGESDQLIVARALLAKVKKRGAD